MTEGESVSARSTARSSFLAVTVIVLCLLLLLYSAHRWFDHDEFEHIHSAWYVANGYVPYSDFFQNHHPLLWYSIAPLLLVFGSNIEAVMVLRIAMFGLTIGIGGVTYLLAQRVTSSRETGLLSVMLLLSMVMFLEKSVEVRPDVPQVLLGLISVYLLLRHLRTGDNRQIALSGLAASLSFLFLQKSIFLLAAYVPIFCYGLVKRKFTLRSSLYFVVSVSLPMVLFLGYLLISGALDDYLLTNWMLHVGQLQPFSPLTHPLRSFATQNALFWLFAPISVVFVLLDSKTSRELKMVAFLGAALLLSVLLLKRPHRQNFMFAVPLLCIAVGYLIRRARARFRLRGVYTGLLVVLFLIQPLAFLAPRSIRSGLRDEQLAKVDFVIHNSTDSDHIYDGDIQFNLYRRDLHYFWFSVGENKGLDTYNAITADKYGDYDICELIRAQQPRFISNYELRLARCGLRPFYEETPFSGLFVRNVRQESEQLLWRNLGDAVALLGYAVEQVSGQDEERLHVTLWWQSLAEMDKDYTVFIHVVAEDGRVSAQEDTLLLSRQRPTSTWRPGDTARQECELTLPDGTRPGSYTLRTGLYHWESGERLPVVDERGDRLADDVIHLVAEPIQ